MSWIERTVESIKKSTSTEPIECPRGWGQVSFGLSLAAFWPWFAIERKCPISGEEECADCSYPHNPDVARLETQLTDLERLRTEHGLSREEYETRRRALLDFHETAPGGDGFRIAAWVLGPLGLLVGASGMALALLVHPGFWGIAGAGAVMMTLSLSFAALMKPRDGGMAVEEY